MHFPVLRSGKKLVKLSKMIALYRFLPLWKTLWKMWITPCKAFPEQALCKRIILSRSRQKSHENSPFRQKLRISGSPVKTLKLASRSKELFLLRNFLHLGLHDYAPYSLPEHKIYG